MKSAKALTKKVASNPVKHPQPRKVSAVEPSGLPVGSIESDRKVESNRPESSESEKWEWLAKGDSSVVDAIKEIIRVNDRLYEEAKGGFTYKHPVHCFVQSSYDAVTKKLKLTDAMKCSLAYDLGLSYREFTCAIYTEKVLGAKVLQGIVSGLEKGDVFGALLYSRCLLERVSTFMQAIKAVAHVKSDQDLGKLSESLVALFNSLANKNHATRINWKNFVQQDFNHSEKVREEDFEYKPKEDYTNLYAKSVMTPIEKLDKEINHVEVTYAALCEFTHPNVGGRYACRVDLKYPEDKNGIPWQHEKIGLERPDAFAVTMGLGGQLFSVLGKTAAYYEKLLFLESEEQGRRLLSMTQTLVRAHLQKASLIKDSVKPHPYSPCLCGSGINAKFCCMATKQET